MITTLNVTFVDVPAFKAVGLPILTKDPLEIPKLWQRFFPNLPTTPKEYFGLFRVPEEVEPGMFEYIAAFEVPVFENLPPNFVPVEVPALTYAILPVKGVEEIQPTLNWFYREFLPTTEFVPVNGITVEVYPPEYPEVKNIELRIPVRPVAIEPIPVEVPKIRVVGLELPNAEILAPYINVLLLKLATMGRFLPTGTILERVYGVWTEMETRVPRYFVGFELPAGIPVPPELMMVEIPMGHYAKVPHRATPAELPLTYANLDAWFEKTLTPRPEGPVFEVFRTDLPINERYEIEIFMPMA